LKKPNKRWKQWHSLRAYNQGKRVSRKTSRRSATFNATAQYHAEQVKIWQGGSPEIAICIRRPKPTPSILCFEQNPEDTVGFLASTRKEMFATLHLGKAHFVMRKKPGGMAKISGYADFSYLRDISLGAAVVLTADYDRASRIVGQVPPAVDLHKWQERVTTRLYELGFFKLLGHLPSAEKLVEDGPTLTMQIVQGKNADELQEVDGSLQILGNFLSDGNADKLNPTIVKVLTTISEAITNVTQHAYSGEHTYQYDHVGSFWVGATADRENRTLSVAVYDQGSTIPITYPRLDLKQKAIRFLRTAISRTPEFENQHDGTYIRAAMRYGGSRTDQSFRGKGLPQMFVLMQSIGSGCMSIRSRAGWCTRAASGRMTQGFLQESIGGTLVEWTINLGEAELGVQHAD
jgi:hypothetical protein